MNFSIVKCIFLLLFSHIFVGAFYEYDIKAENSQLVNLLENILKNYIHTGDYDVLINTNFLQLERVQAVKDIISELLHRIDYIPIILSPEITESFDDNVDFTIYFAENEDDVFSIQHTTQSKYLVILLQGDQLKDIQKVAKTIFRHFFDQYVIDITLLVNGTIDGTDDIKMYTYFPYRPCNCASVMPVLLKTFKELENSLNISRTDLFPRKIGNFYGCPLKVTTWQIVPFVIFTKSLRNGDTFDGIDISLLRIFAKKFNFTLNIEKNMPADLMGGNIFKNGTITGAYKQLHEHKANITIGSSTCTATRQRLFSTVVPYFQTTFILVLKPSEYYTSIEILLFPFDIHTWCLLLALAALRFLRPYIRRIFPGLSKSSLYMTHGAYLILFFTLRMSYECSFYKFMRYIPTKPLPLTVNELILRNYSVIVDHAKYRRLVEIPELFSITRVVSGEPIEAIAALEHAPPKTAVFTGNMFLAHYLKRNLFKLKELAIVSEPVFGNELCMYFTRYSYLTEIFNNELLRIRGAGILKHLADVYGFVFLPPTTAAFKHHVGSNDHANPIGLDMLSGVFMALLYMQCLAFGIFLVEVMYVRCSKRFHLS